MAGLELLERLQGLGVHVEATGDKLTLTPGSRVPPDMLAQVKESKPLILAYLKAPRPIIDRAFALADHVNDAQGITDPRARQSNRLGWAVCDLQDAGEPEEVWKPLQEEERRLGRRWEWTSGKQPK